MNLKEIQVEAEVVQAHLQQYRVKWRSFWLLAVRMLEEISI